MDLTSIVLWTFSFHHRLQDYLQNENNEVVFQINCVTLHLQYLKIVCHFPTKF